MMPPGNGRPIGPTFTALTSLGTDTEKAADPKATAMPSTVRAAYVVAGAPVGSAQVSVT